MLTKMIANHTKKKKTIKYSKNSEMVEFNESEYKSKTEAVTKFNVALDQ
jgi:hypothetical protein